MNTPNTLASDITFKMGFFFLLTFFALQIVDIFTNTLPTSIFGFSWSKQNLASSQAQLEGGCDRRKWSNLLHNRIQHHMWSSHFRQHNLSWMWPKYVCTSSHKHSCGFTIQSCSSCMWKIALNLSNSYATVNYTWLEQFYIFTLLACIWELQFQD